MTSRIWAGPRMEALRPSPSCRRCLNLTVAVSSLWVVLALPRAARAQSAFALERFTPAPAGDRFLGVPSPYVAGDLDLHAGLFTDYAYRPLVLHSPPATEESLVSYQVVLHANLSLSLNRRVLVNLDVPAFSVQGGETTPAMHRVDFGDVRLGGRVRLWGENASPFQVGVGGYFWLPTATGATSGDGAVRGMPYVALGGLWGPLLWSGMVGAEFRPSQNYEGVVRQGTSLDFGGGLAYLVDEQRRFQLGMESVVSFVLAEPASRNLNAELMFHGRYRFLDRFEAGVGLGPGLSQGVGTPAVRGVVFFAYVPVADLNRPEPAVLAVAENPAVSADGLLARSLRLSTLPAMPPDPSCCSVPPRVGQPPHKASSPARAASVPDGRIFFAVGSAEVQPSAERAIHAVADYLILHPELENVEICGYADIHGTVASNLQLAQRRAETVKGALIRHSVAGQRLAIRSFGATPLAASSTSSSGMAQNRQVVIRFGEPTRSGGRESPEP